MFTPSIVLSESYLNTLFNFLLLYTQNIRSALKFSRPRTFMLSWLRKRYTSLKDPVFQICCIRTSTSRVSTSLRQLLVSAYPINLWVNSSLGGDFHESIFLTFHRVSSRIAYEGRELKAYTLLINIICNHRVAGLIIITGLYKSNSPLP